MEVPVSLPAHLHASLSALLPIQILPESLATLLKKHIQPSAEDSSSEVPYELLHRVSQWTQTPEGKIELSGRDISPSDYSMIALLSGTMSSPSAKLAPYKPPLTPEEKAIQKAKERKAISALINGLLSVVGVGVAAWWAGGSISMRPDYKALLSVFSAMVVAATEATLYLIWQWRYDTALKKVQHRTVGTRKRLEDVLEVDVDSGLVTPTDVDGKPDEGLRKRAPPAAVDE